MEEMTSFTKSLGKHDHHTKGYYCTGYNPFYSHAIYVEFFTRQKQKHRINTNTATIGTEYVLEWQ